MVAGIDIGGTKIAAAVVSDTAEITGRVELPTRAAEGYEVSMAQVWEAVKAVARDGVRAIGICSPGPLNPKTGVVLNPPNLPGWHDVPLAAEVSRRFGLPCRVENDANAAGLAETLFGAARGCQSVLYVTLSTGIGTGIAIGGRIYHGRNGAAAEGGHVTIDYQSDAVCNCGSRGCVEALASGAAMAARAERLLPLYPGSALRAPVTAESVGRAAAAGDRLALRVLEETCTMLGAWLGSMISVLDPEIVVIGGGVSQIGEPLFSRLRRIAPQRTINRLAAEIPIVPAALGRDSGVLGAAAAVMAEW